MVGEHVVGRWVQRAGDKEGCALPQDIFKGSAGRANLWRGFAFGDEDVHVEGFAHFFYAFACDEMCMLA